ncbi:MAG TPA: AraC family transcriptional regulator [Verrucomicrobiales bacterium]|jgi:AraC-like DNA-binding protein|nr:AraC family transcriptional regulator [Verrucomicrobiales bacterium]
MNQIWPGQPVFGEPNESALWAWNFSPLPSGETTTLSFASGQFLVILPISSFVDLACGELRSEVEPGSVGLIRAEGSPPPSLSFGTATEVFVLGIRRTLLEEMLASFRPGLIPEVRELIFSDRGDALNSRPIHGKILTEVLPAFLNTPVSGAARSFWFEGQFKVLLSLMCFTASESSSEFFCSRQKRLSLSRVRKAKAYLEEHLEAAIDLPMLASLVDCSPFYLSRTFSATTGMTISHYLRKVRIEKAAELLRSGRCNVSEAATEVGYHSLSHFSKAFQQVKGCLPSKYEAL